MMTPQRKIKTCEAKNNSSKTPLIWFSVTKGRSGEGHFSQSPFSAGRQLISLVIYLVIVLLASPIFLGCQNNNNKPSKPIEKLSAPVDTLNLKPNEHLGKVQVTLVLRPQDIDAAWPSSSTARNWRSDNLPPWLTLDPNTGVLTGMPTVAEKIENIKVSYDEESTTKDLPLFTLIVLSDALVDEQWHLNNTGQSTFATQPGVSDQDLKLLPLWKVGLTGNKLVVAISDTAFELKHEDLYKNAYLGAHRDYVNGSSSNGYAGLPSITTDTDNFHGTGVAGIIGAVGWNQLGVRGIAPNVTLTSLNFIESDQSINKMIDQVTGGFSVVNQSWSASLKLPTTIEIDYLNALKAATTNQRNGRGTIIVKAAGNGDIAGIASENANQDPYNNNPYTIVVGALNAKGVKASYSSIGSSLWISAPGGEYGTTDPAILTTDISGCQAGLSKSTSTKNNFDKGLVDSNKDCRYTSAFNGTSAATPMVTGAVALLLEKYPQLSWRDIKHILALSARTVDPNSPPIIYNDTNTPIEISLGWVLNGAGFRFHNHYGFGALDITAALARAATHTPLPPASEFAMASRTGINAPIGTTTSESLDTSLSSTVQKTIESIELTARVSHSYFGDISIEVISPSGTRSLLLTPLNTFQGVNDSAGNYISSTKYLKFTSHAFYGEPAVGSWRVIVRDQIPMDQGQVLDLTLRGFGR